MCDDEFRLALMRLENYYETRGMSETIRRCVKLAARSLPRVRTGEPSIAGFVEFCHEQKVLDNEKGGDA